MSSELKNIIEALMMVSDIPLSVSKIQSVFEKNSHPGADEIKNEIAKLQEDCENRGVEIRKIGSGYRYQTKLQYADWIRKLQSGRPPRLSRAQLETLAIIAYRQPVTRGDIEDIRGVGVSPEIVQRLLEREWIKQIGVRDVPGRPELFGTTIEFLSYFDIESLSELPPLMEQREFGEISRDLDQPLSPELLSVLEKSVEDDGDVDAQDDLFEAGQEAAEILDRDDAAIKILEPDAENN